MEESAAVPSITSEELFQDVDGAIIAILILILISTYVEWKIQSPQFFCVTEVKYE